jgi:uncharacterized damage-inducible protein DinB
MTSERDRLEEQLRLVFEGEAWHGPSVMEALKDVSADVAAARPIDGAHSIWELVLHLAWTYSLVLSKLTGNPAMLSAPEDWPLVALLPTEDKWLAAIDTLRELNLQIRRAAANLPEERLNERAVGQPRTPYALFIGLTQHDSYHGGQIMLLKRAIHARTPA